MAQNKQRAISKQATWTITSIGLKAKFRSGFWLSLQWDLRATGQELQQESKRIWILHSIFLKQEVFRLWAKLESEPKAARKVAIYTMTTDPMHSNGNKCSILEVSHVESLRNALGYNLVECLTSKMRVQKSQHHVGQGGQHPISSRLLCQAQGRHMSLPKLWMVSDLTWVEVS